MALIILAEGPHGFILHAVFSVTNIQMILKHSQ